MARDHESAQVVVVGAGPGGYAAAFHAADLGLDVTLIDPESNPGGVCVYRGCIPSKALLHAAKVVRLARESANWGISFAQPEIDLSRMRSWKDEVVAKLTQGLGLLSRQRKIRYVRGRAAFLSAVTLAIDTSDAGAIQIDFEHAILATGSRPIQLPGTPTSPEGVWDSTSALELGEIPPSLLVVGGGYIGLEMGTLYAALGSRVTVVEMTEGLVPGTDADLISTYQKQAARAFERILLSTKVVEIQGRNGGFRLRLEGHGNESQVADFDRILVAVGRRPVTENLGLENTRVRVTDAGYVKVDHQRRTDEPSIFAIGDLTGPPLLAHKASHEGRVAAETIAGRVSAFEPHAIPAVQFTDPEIATCGLSETEAARHGRRVEIARFPWTASGRAATLGRRDGLTKLLVEPETGRVLGVGIVGPDAGELISEGALAVEMAALASDVAATIHPHPTLSETIMEAAQSFGGMSTHFFGKRS